MAKPRPKAKKKVEEQSALDASLEGYRILGRGAKQGIEAISGCISWIRKKRK